MTTAEELVVSIVSEGTEEATEDLEGMEDAMEETADAAGDSAEELENFSQRFQGALSAAVAGLAVGVGGLLSTVPVVGETMSGLFAIFEAFGFQIDRLARQMGAGGLSGVLFDVADTIFELEGAMGNIAAVFGVVAAAAASAGVTFAGWALKTMGVKAAAVALGGALKSAGVAIAGILTGITALAAAKAILIAATVAFAAAYLTNFRGVRDSTHEIVGSIIDTVVGGFTSFVSGALDALSDFASGVRSALSDVAARFTSWAGDLAGRAFEWGRGILTRFISGIESMLGALRDVLDDLPFIGRILDLFDRLSDAIGDLDFESDISASVGGTIFGDGGGGGGGGGGASGRPRFGAGGGASTGGQQIDGRQITESTGRYRSDPSNRRGL